MRRKLERKTQEWIDAGAGKEGLLGTSGLVEAESFLSGPDGRELPEDDSIRRLIRKSAAEIRRAETERDGPLVARVVNQFWTPTSYSPLK